MISLATAITGRPLAAAVLFAILLVGASASALETFAKSALVIATAQGERKFQVEIARTPAQQAQGLMFRRKMALEAGMLFPYDPPRKVAFWMKNTLIPLDMIFIAPDGRIESIRARTVPQSLEPMRSRGKVMAVLELNGGAADRFGIKRGDRVSGPALAK